VETYALWITFVKDSCTAFHANRTDGSVANIRSQTERRTEV